jgi:hypothetical protein
VRRQHDDRQIAAQRPRLPHHLHAVHARHQHVQQHQIIRGRRQQLQRLRPGSGHIHAIAVLAQHFAHRFADGALVIHDEQARCHQYRLCAEQFGHASAPEA